MAARSIITCKCGKTVTHTRGIGADGRGFVTAVRLDGRNVTCPRDCDGPAVTHAAPHRS